MGESIKLKHAYRAIPYNRASVFQLLGQQVRRFAGQCPKSDRRRRHRLPPSRWRVRLLQRFWPPPRRWESAPPRRALAWRRSPLWHRLSSLGSASDLPIFKPAANMKVLAMPPPTIKPSTLLDKRLQNSQLGADLAARHDGNQRALRRGQGFANGIHLGGQQRARAGHGRILRNAVGAGFGAVGGAKRVVHKNIAQAWPFFAPTLGAFFFSPTLTRQFSSSTTWPGARAWPLTCTPSTQLATSGTGRPNSSAMRAATGAKESAVETHLRWGGPNVT